MQPVPELEKLRTGTQEYAFDGCSEFEIPDACDIEIKCGAPFEMELSGVHLTVKDGRLLLQIPEGGYGRMMRTAPVPSFRGMRMLVDTSALEIFAEDGTVVLSTRWFPDETTRTMGVRGSGSVHVHPMRPLQIWQDLEERISRRIEPEILT